MEYWTNLGNYSPAGYDAEEEVDGLYQALQVERNKPIGKMYTAS